MPRYDYVCPECHVKVEISMGYEQVKVSAFRCPRCAKWMERLIPAVSLIFKGHGFYCTDNREEHKEEGVRG